MFLSTWVLFGSWVFQCTERFEIVLVVVVYECVVIRVEWRVYLIWQVGISQIDVVLKTFFIIKVQGTNSSVDGTDTSLFVVLYRFLKCLKSQGILLAFELSNSKVVLRDRFTVDGYFFIQIESFLF